MVHPYFPKSEHIGFLVTLIFHKLFTRYKNFDSANILISGAASGIGKSIANAFINLGCKHLLLIDINLKGLSEIKDSTSKNFIKEKIEIFQVDVASSASVNSFITQLGNRKIDILINSAGVVNVGTFENTSIEEIEKVIQVNLMGTIRLTHALLPLLFKSKKPSIINISSMAGYIAAPGMAAYSASKFGLNGFADAIRKELGKNIQICTIAPAFVKTNLALNAVSNSNNNKEKMHSFLCKVGSNPEIVNQAVVYALKYNLSQKLVGMQAYLLWFSHKFFPFMGKKIITYGYELLKKEGIISSQK